MSCLIVMADIWSLNLHEMVWNGYLLYRAHRLYLMLFSKDRICKFMHFSCGELRRADVLNNMEPPMMTIPCSDSLDPLVLRVGCLVWFASTRCPTVELLWLALWWLEVDCIVLTSITLLRWFSSPSLSSMETKLLLSRSRFCLPFSWMFWIYLLCRFCLTSCCSFKGVTKLSLSRSGSLILVFTSDVIKQRFRFLCRNSLRSCKSLNLSLFRS